MVIYETSIIVFTWSIINVQSVDNDWQLWFYALSFIKVRVIFEMMSVELSSMSKHNLCSVQFRIYCMIFDALSLAAAALKLKSIVSRYCFLLSSLVENIVDTWNMCVKFRILHCHLVDNLAFRVWHNAYYETYFMKVAWMKAAMIIIIIV